MSAAGVVIGAVGDVLVDRDEPVNAFAKVRHLFAGVDVRFGNCEGVYSTTAERNAASWSCLLTDPRNFEGVRPLDFDVMSFANNHAMDASYGGLFDTLALLRDAGIRPVGAGEDLDAARAPVVVESGGLRIGFLAYTCVYAPGFEAAPGRAGCATIEIHTIYRHELGQPGTRPVLYTLADPPTKQEIMGEIARAREAVDVLVASFHWGIHQLPAVITDYERELGRAAVEAGADVVLGHHQHILKGVELHRGKPILYGLGNFLFEGTERRMGSGSHARTKMEPFRPFYGEHLSLTEHRAEDKKQSMFVRIACGNGGVAGVSIVPCSLDGDGDPVQLEPGSPGFAYFHDYLDRITSEAGLEARLSVAGDALRLEL